MDPSDSDRSSEPDRNASRLPYGLGHDDDDDYYDLQALGVSDGFRPVEAAQDQTAPHVARSSTSSLDHQAPRAASPRPSSISKPYPTYESPLSHEGFGQTPLRSPGMPTDSLAMTVEAPYNGPLGPSHPYQMYPQDVLRARATSSATTSTRSISGQSYNGPRHPTHPYGIYSQNVTFGDDESNNRPQRGANVMFPGTADLYQRRLGPDGEEAADMIGPDGHTEQLPPYSRYPQEIYGRNPPGIDIAQPELLPLPAQSNPGIPGAGGIGLATRNPEFASTEDLNHLNSPQSCGSVMSFRSEASDHSINSAAKAATNEKSTPNWKEAARRKVWGVIPCWAVVLGVIALVLLGVVVGTVIGTVIAPHLNKDHNKPPDSDPGPAPGPAGPAPQAMPPLPEGNYSLPLVVPHYTSNCVKYSSQSKAWNCDAILSELVMTVSRQQDPADTAAYELYFTYNHSFTEDSYVYSYGVQPPSITIQQLQLVNDPYEPSMGPAWALIIPYNKTVILPETYLTPSNDTSPDSVKKRANMDDLELKGVVQSGARPWICTWPGTVLEVFIYVSQNGSSQGYSTSDAAAALTGAKWSGRYRRDVMARQHGHIAQQEDDAQNSNYPPSTTTQSPTPIVPSITPTVSNEPNYFSPLPLPPSPYSRYPKVVKIVERYEPEIGAPPPTCRQVEIMGSGVEAVPLYNNTSRRLIEIQIMESLPENENKQIGLSLLKHRALHQLLSTRQYDTPDDDDSDCGCTWWVT